MSCEFTHLDGAYVLGALSAAERQDFERHLLTCAECSRAVRELAGLPGLLAHVSLADVEPADVQPVPATVLPALVREVHAAQRRRTTLVAAVAAGVAAVAVAALGVGGAFDGGERTTLAPPSATSTAAATPSATPMEPVGPSPVAAVVSLASVAWGTRLDVTCSYEDADEAYEAPPDATYALVVRTRDGGAEEVATWHGLPGRTMRLSAATATRRDQIASVEMRTAEGLVVLRLPV